jgi:hypothetical protein
MVDGGTHLLHKRQEPGPHSAAEVAAPAHSPQKHPLSKAAPSPLARRLAAPQPAPPELARAAVPLQPPWTPPAVAAPADLTAAVSVLPFLAEPSEQEAHENELSASG